METNLIAEIERYLAVVALFRAEGCDPHWVPELLLPADEVRAGLGTAASLGQ